MPGSTDGVGTGQDAPGACPVNWMQEGGASINCLSHSTGTPQQDLVKNSMRCFVLARLPP